ncbi:MAG: hypothetical protein ACUVRV_09995 [Cyanobacteriota bacterium]
MNDDMLKNTLPLLALLAGFVLLGPTLILEATDFILGYPVDFIRVQREGSSRPPQMLSGGRSGAGSP